MTALEYVQLAALLLSPIAAAAGGYLGVGIKLAKLEAGHLELQRRCDENRDDIRRQSSRIDELAGLAR